MAISVVIVEDHHIVREGLVKFMEGLDYVNVIAQASDGIEAIAACQEHQPDLVILDVSMPRMRGTEAIVKIKDVSPDSVVLILSQYDQADYIKHSLKNGASGYLLKQSAAEELEAAISRVMKGQIYISPEIATHIVSDWILKSDSVEDGPGKVLTSREIEVLKLVAEGYTNKSVASLLHISSKTVETHRSRIMKKLELETYADLVKYAVKTGIIE